MCLGMWIEPAQQTVVELNEVLPIVGMDLVKWLARDAQLESIHAEAVGQGKTHVKLSLDFQEETRFAGKVQWSQTDATIIKTAKSAVPVWPIRNWRAR